MAPVPCSLNEKPWSAIEHDGFVLGLYVFGKNFRVVNKFVGNKGMPNVMSYYYGKFYRSSEHQKWSVYKKKRGRKPIPGKRIFCGWRRHELLSRLLPKVTDECKNSLTQVVRAFDEGKLSFEKYVFALRDTVGMNLLIESIAMGKGKHDLISKTRRTLRNKKLQSTQASLKTEQIVDSLKDIIGLSKARLHHLFWEVVWPRLLERGWHSEQPKSYIFHNSKNPLVFLAPGVTKFSRSLEKGSQYFDSMTDVLNKVAAEPHLLEDQPLPDQLVDPRVKQRPDDEQDLMKYTIVDTSLVRPVTVVSEPADMQASTSVSEETEHDTTEESQNEDAEDKDSTVCEMNNPEPVRKLKLVFKHKTKRQQVNSITINSASDDDEKKRTRIVMDSNNPRAGPDTDGDKQSDLTETTTNNQTELLSAGTNGQRQSRRSRVLTTKAVEALANGFLTPKKRRGGLEDGTRRRVRGKTALVSSCGVPCINNLGDGVFSGSSHMVSDS
ncbi:uncharacterized protein LOC143564205 [Bidens hawaiensis]|uniref:uncharacterized protein LOC143564205 n=1 Tax=Bidens hawaiensis TaxID=980011 RepID=UPI00404AAD06